MMRSFAILPILSSLLTIGGYDMGVAQEPVFSHDMDARSMLETVRVLAEKGDSRYTTCASDLLEKLAITPVVSCQGRDEYLRPLFVHAQADFERAIVHWLQGKYIEECTCIIHTPAPATPLCTNGAISIGLVDPVIASDPHRLLTVTERPDIIRAYLCEGGHLLAAYPQGGRALRSAEQLAVFDGLLQKYPRLQALELDVDQIPEDLIGATYLIRVVDGTEYVLSLRSYQAHSPTDGTWAIWFGLRQDPVILERVERVLSFLGLPRCWAVDRTQPQ